MKEDLSLKRLLKSLEEKAAEDYGAVDAYLKVLERIERPAPDVPIEGLMGRIGELEQRIAFLETLRNVRVLPGQVVQ